MITSTSMSLVSNSCRVACLGSRNALFGNPRSYPPCGVEPLLEDASVVLAARQRPLHVGDPLLELRDRRLVVGQRGAQLVHLVGKTTVFYVNIYGWSRSQLKQQTNIDSQVCFLLHINPA